MAGTKKKPVGKMIITKRKVMERLEDAMVAVTFAEAGEHKTARELIKNDYKKRNIDYEKKITGLKERASQSGIAMDISFAAMDVVSSVRNFIRQNKSVDMVLLSPSITSDGHLTSRELNRLVKTTSRPIVTMSKQAHIAYKK